MPFRGGGVHTIALGHEQPYNIVAILACERLLPSVNQPLNVAILKCPIFNGSFHQQQSFKLLEKPFCEGLESAKSGRPINLDNDTGLTPVNAPQRHDPVSLRAYETKIV